MKVAVIFSGNVRTFFMPLRENPHYRVCDLLDQNIVKSTNADVFIVADVDNFYHEGIQYFYDDKQTTNKKIDTFNFDACRFNTVIKFSDYVNSFNILNQSFKNLFGDRIINMSIESPYDVSNHSKLNFLKQHINMGCVPEFMIQQHYKLNKAYNMICEYEKKNNFNYDVIMRFRFDNIVVPQINLEQYDFNLIDIFVPHIKGPVIFDWSAIGNRKAMHHYCNLYNELGFTLERGMSYMYECSRCGICIEEHEHENYPKPFCPCCHSNEHIWIGNITLSSEHHVLEMIKKYNLRCSVAHNQTHIYRYNTSSEMLNKDILKQLGNITLNSYTMHGGLTEYSI